jgi:hypothetical protein
MAALVAQEIMGRDKVAPPGWWPSTRAMCLKTAKPTTLEFAIAVADDWQSLAWSYR